ncbi:MAG: hypothetical protein U9N38_01040 [Thermodesulfobacteriota bacterium]|nr:hypothetical protein [Thermodesulfobacteriota bacterium]
MEKFNVYISEQLKNIIKRPAKTLSPVVEENLMSLYALLTVTSDEMDKYFTSQEMALLRELS